MAKSAKSIKTSIMGVVQAVGLILVGYGYMSNEHWALWVGLANAVLGAALGGWFARDDNVTSEGTVAPKLLLLGLVVPLLLGSPGCSSTAGGSSFRQANTLYVGAVDIATTLARTGVLQLDDAEKFEQARAEARQLLDTWDSLIRSGQGSDFDGLDRLEALLDAMIAVQEGHADAQHSGGNGSAQGDARQRPGGRFDDPRGYAVGPGSDGAGARAPEPGPRRCGCVLACGTRAAA